MSTEDTQQFCLRWHNYQSSLLATLPQLLDGDDLTDVTLCAGSRSLKAHRVVLSACSEYFKELFKVRTRTLFCCPESSRLHSVTTYYNRACMCVFSAQELGPSHHPVIVLPGVEFTDLCALVTFMYSGEVNIYESQLASLLSMADVLHIRGLADFSNVSTSHKSSRSVTFGARARLIRIHGLRRQPMYLRSRRINVLDTAKGRISFRKWRINPHCPRRPRTSSTTGRPRLSAIPIRTRRIPFKIWVNVYHRVPIVIHWILTITTTTTITLVITITTTVTIITTIRWMVTPSSNGWSSSKWKITYPRRLQMPRNLRQRPIWRIVST